VSSNAKKKLCFAKSVSIVIEIGKLRTEKLKTVKQSSMTCWYQYQLQLSGETSIYDADMSAYISFSLNLRLS
jgi:hypothetical protein